MPRRVASMAVQSRLALAVTSRKSRVPAMALSALVSVEATTLCAPRRLASSCLLSDEVNAVTSQPQALRKRNAR
ncbi:hypothetical protein D9M73_242910 [compost metagenome]